MSLGFTTSRSIVSPGASSTYSAERSDYGDYPDNAAGRDDSAEEDAQVDRMAKRGSVTWSAEVLARRAQDIQTENVSAKAAANYAMTNSGRAGGGGGGGGGKKGKSGSNITYESNWDQDAQRQKQKGGGNAAESRSPQKKRIGGSEGGAAGSKLKSKAAGMSKTSAYNVGVKSTTKNAERSKDSGKKAGGPKGGRGKVGGGRNQGRGGGGKKKMKRENPDTLTRAQYAIQSASAVLLDGVGPA